MDGTAAMESHAPGIDPATSLEVPTEPERLRKRARRDLLEGNISPEPRLHRQSLELTSRGSVATGVELRRSRSMWGRNQVQDAIDDAPGGFQERYDLNFGKSTVSQRRRTLNVKRARKMAQLFGQEPPSELFQIQREEGSLSEAAPGPLRQRADSTTSIPGEVDDDPSTLSLPFVDDPRDSAFQERRRRAAKLARFFGVGYQDIVLPALPTSFFDTDADVDVKVTGKGRRFWSFSDRTKDGDMAEAIHKLRGLKAN
ncbi:unnamed protein product [Mycena citricolor]|uniref:Uncharacterized protein n=1 Tax=Mycena citricolor TaxID=2018698 RepID=A0AAD2JW63_9AGAR|nr:unnamed protein product [Mycena citricolor]